ncbi:MAG: alpha/beta hydrolase [Proteobacteria bacterium]|nr:alpha/beta hydrolase [Pseudomonadota bacterium]
MPDDSVTPALTATQPRECSFASLSAHGFHRLAYCEWGDPGNDRVVVCVHGLTRNARDFDVLAERLARTHRVLAVDMPGRGNSEWLPNADDYTFPTYLTALTALFARAGVASLDYVGTSMGGLLGMILAAQPGTPIRRLVVNDVGPALEASAIQRIASYVGGAPSFPTFADAERYVRQVSAPFGPLTDAQWRFVTATNVRRHADGHWQMAYDPGIAQPFRTQATPPDLWPVWDAIRVPTLVLRGALSDLLTAATLDAMAGRGPKALVRTFAGVGHAPMLMADDQVAAVAEFLEPAPAGA